MSQYAKKMAFLLKNLRQTRGNPCLSYDGINFVNTQHKCPLSSPHPSLPPLVSKVSTTDSNELTERQQRVYEVIREKINSRGYGPTVREIGEILTFLLRME